MPGGIPQTPFDVRRAETHRRLGFRAEQVLSFVHEAIATDGQPPSYSMISDALGFAGRFQVCKVIQRLEARGLLNRQGQGRERRIRVP